MTVYRDAKHCIARIMSIDAIDGTAKASWQVKYQAPGWRESQSGGSGMSSCDRLAQDSVTRRILKRELNGAHWHALVARRSINDNDVAESAKWLARHMPSPAHCNFRLSAVAAWVAPRRAEGQKSTHTLPDDCYKVHLWDSTGRPEGTLRRWKSEIDRWLNRQLGDAHGDVERLLKEYGLKIGVSGF